MQQHNSTITSASYMLGIPADAVYNFKQTWDKAKEQATPTTTLEKVTEQIVGEVEKVNPLLASHWKLLKLLKDRGYPYSE
jgi:hypothetical protein